MKHFALRIFSSAFLLFLLTSPALAQRYTFGIEQLDRGSAVIFFNSPAFEEDEATKSFTQQSSVEYIGNDMEDRISSVVVPAGMVVTIYEHRGGQGRSAKLYPGNYNHLMNFNDRISSFRIDAFDDANNPRVYLYEHGDIYTRRQGMQGFAEGEYAKSELLCNDCFTYARVQPGAQVLLFRNDLSDPMNESNLLKARGDKPTDFDLRRLGMNDAVSGVRVSVPGYALSHVEYKNRTVVKTEEERRIGGTSWQDGFNAVAESEQTVDVGWEYQASVTRSVSNSTALGFKTTVSSTITVGSAPVQAALTVALEKSIQNTTTVGRDKTESYTQRKTFSQKTKTPPGCRTKVTVMGTPEEVIYDVVETYVEVNEEGDKVRNGKTREVKSKVRVKSATNVRGVVEGDCQGDKTSPPIATTTAGTTPQQPTTSTTSTYGQKEFGSGNDGTEVNLPGTFNVYRNGRQYSEIEWDSEESVWSEWDMEGDWLGDYRETERNSIMLVLVDTDSGKELSIEHNKQGSILVKPSANAANSSIETYGSLTAAGSGGMGNGQLATSGGSDDPAPSSYGEETFGYDAEAIREAGDTGSEPAETFEVIDEDGYFICQLSFDAEDSLWLEVDEDDDLVGEYKVTARDGQRLEMREIDYGTLLTVDLSSGKVYSDSSGEQELVGYINR
ncbi:hypothetical protein LEM8419_00682 [Neolewinella maritima]|uniref:Beta/gamma crystallin 'Greek key' domain-containing protein n=1 Tax=Neolewinella maritima TaxID=1383882 RepID=A0ABN8EZP5_9BACT|nr:hypothetical protein [Neolewinella maritima]CAH0999384.1 hypothetical protein LEM8419_00682 [Neolewinella maritima]